MSGNEFDLDLFEKSVSYHFENIELLHESLINATLVNEDKSISKDQAALSTLGDAILGAILADMAYHKQGSTPELITDSKKEYGANIALAQLAKRKRFRINDFLKRGKGEGAKLDEFERCDCPIEKMNSTQRGGATHYANCIEAIIGAIYLDSNFEKTKQVVMGWLE